MEGTRTGSGFLGGGGIYSFVPRRSSFNVRDMVRGFDGDRVSASSSLSRSVAAFSVPSRVLSRKYLARRINCECEIGAPSARELGSSRSLRLDGETDSTAERMREVVTRRTMPGGAEGTEGLSVGY